MAVQPKYHWQFEEREGSIAKDTVSEVEGRFQGVLWEGHGRIGHAIRVRGKEGRVNLGNVAGQFGTSDFTIAFGINLLHTHDQNDVDIIGNRSVRGHGNWVSLRTMNKRELFFEVAEDSNGKHYATARTGRVLTPKKMAAYRRCAGRANAQDLCRWGARGGRRIRNRCCQYPERR